MIKYEVRFEAQSRQHCVVAFQPCLGGHSSCGEVVYSSSNVYEAEQARDRLILDQDPAFQNYMAKMEAYAFEECFV